MSRAELVRITGISFPTVSKIVDKLLELGIVIELEETEQSSGAGRKGHLLKFNPRAVMPLALNSKARLFIWVWLICWAPASTADPFIFPLRIIP